jgi:NEDD8-activating enzyme E1 regulatory subunit
MASTNKYDRQVRLWGSHGQKLLSESRILCLGASGAASETLKNLILPQIESFTIVDDAIVTDRDRGQNFFFLKEDVGKSAAERMCINLEELNGEDVKGYFKNENISEFIKSSENW